VIRIDGHRRVIEEHLQPRATLLRVVQRLRQRALRQQLRAMALLSAPPPEGFDDWPGVGLAVGALVLAGERVDANLLPSLSAGASAP